MRNFVLCFVVLSCFTVNAQAQDRRAGLIALVFRADFLSEADVRTFHSLQSENLPVIDFLAASDIAKQKCVDIGFHMMGNENTDIYQYRFKLLLSSLDGVDFQKLGQQFEAVFTNLGVKSKVTVTASEFQPLYPDTVMGGVHLVAMDHYGTGVIRKIAAKLPRFNDSCETGRTSEKLSREGRGFLKANGMDPNFWFISLRSTDMSKLIYEWRLIK